MATEVEVEVLKSKGNGFPPTVDHCFVTGSYFFSLKLYTPDVTASSLVKI